MKPRPTINGYNLPKKGQYMTLEEIQSEAHPVFRMLRELREKTDKANDVFAYKHSGGYIIMLNDLNKVISIDSHRSCIADYGNVESVGMFFNTHQLHTGNKPFSYGGLFEHILKKPTALSFQKFELVPEDVVLRILPALITRKAIRVKAIALIKAWYSNMTMHAIIGQSSYQELLMMYLKFSGPVAIRMAMYEHSAFYDIIVNDTYLKQYHVKKKRATKSEDRIQKKTVPSGEAEFTDELFGQQLVDLQRRASLLASKKSLEQNAEEIFGNKTSNKKASK